MSLNLTDILISVGNAVFIFGFFKLRPKNISKEHALGLPITMLIIGFVFAKLAYGFFANIDFWDIKNLLRYSAGGYSIKGGVIGAFSACIIYLKYFNLSVTAVSEIIVPIWCLAHTLWRAGCIAAGCCYGGIIQNTFLVYLNKVTGAKNITSMPLPVFEITLLLILAIILGPFRPKILQSKYLILYFMFSYFTYVFIATHL